ncbi:hypothetical protein SG18_29335 [Pandoraea apista]|nr:hypothetical protein SG18_29335 [Pandoraea apista]
MKKGIRRDAFFIALDGHTLRVSAPMSPESPNARKPGFSRAQRSVGSSGASCEGSSGDSAGIVYFSAAQAPMSICLQRSEQNGRNFA